MPLSAAALSEAVVDFQKSMVATNMCCRKRPAQDFTIREVTKKRRSNASGGGWWKGTAV
jgi:hypothetical protein